MGKLNSVVTFKGRTGNLVGAKGFKGSTVLRQYQPTVANPNTEKQRTQRTKFLAATSLANNCPELALAGLRGYAKTVGCSVRNAMSKIMLKNYGAVDGWTKTVDGDQISMAYARQSLKFSKGNLMPAEFGAPQMDTPGQVSVSVTLPAGAVPAHCRAIVVLVNSELTEGNVLAKEVSFSTASATATITVPMSWSGLHGYLFGYYQDFGSEENLRAYYTALSSAALSDVYLAEANAANSPTQFLGSGVLS